MLINENALRALVADYELKTGQQAACRDRLYLGAQDLCATALTPAWVVRHLWPLGEAGSAYYRTASKEHSLGRFIHFDRVVALGEMILNLHSVAGFENQLTILKAGDLEGVVGALESASLLVRCDIPLRFVPPIGMSGRDFDAEIQFAGKSYPVEFKSKVETTTYSPSSVLDSLEKARRQVPRHSAAVVFIRIPVTWDIDERRLTELDSVITNRLSRTGRISAVGLHWERWTMEQAGYAIREVGMRLVANAKTHPLLSALSLQRLAGPTSIRWKQLEDILCDPDVPRDFVRA